jgi:transcriptional regulator with XRE-family HTH domain
VDSQRVGDRLRRLRKLRGATQQQLAANTHFSVSLIKKVEQGSVPPSAAFVATVARALQVKPAYLYGTEERELAEQPQVEAAGIAELRAALDGFDDPRPAGGLLSLSEATRRVQKIAGDVYRLRYGDAARDLPELLPICTCSPGGLVTMAIRLVGRCTTRTVWRPAWRASSGRPISPRSRPSGTSISRP